MFSERCKSLNVCVCVLYFECCYKVSALRPFFPSSNSISIAPMIGAKSSISFSSSFYALLLFKLKFFNGQLFRLFRVCVCVCVQNRSKFYNFLSQNSNFLLSPSRIKSKKIKLESNLNGLLSDLFAKKMHFSFWFCGSLHLDLYLHYNNICTYAFAS